MNKFSLKLSLTYIANTMAIIRTIINRSWRTCALTPRPRHLRNSLGGRRQKKGGEGGVGGGGGGTKREVGKGVIFPLPSFSLSPYLFQCLHCG